MRDLFKMQLTWEFVAPEGISFLHEGRQKKLSEGRPRDGSSELTELFIGSSFAALFGGLAQQCLPPGEDRYGIPARDLRGRRS